MSSLALTVPGGIYDWGHRICLPAKTLGGLVELAKCWDGEVAFVTEAITGQVTPTAPAGWIDVERAALPFTVLATADRAATVAALRPDLTLVTLTQGELPFIESLTTPYVVLTEFDTAGRLAVLVASSPGPRLPLRVRLGMHRLERRMSRVVARAAGVQANGPVSYKAYASHTANPLLFFDSRITKATVDSAASVTRPGGSEVTFAFSGRWIPAKGFDDAITAFISAYDRSSLPLRLQLFGGGEGVVPDHPGIEIFGNVDFDREWIPHFSSQVDYLLIPHRQPDPSCTYLEGAGLGVPFLSYDNEHASWLAVHGLGRVAPLGDTAALTELVLHAANHPASRPPLAMKGREFMSAHSFETEMKARRMHLAACAGSPGT